MRPSNITQMIYLSERQFLIFIFHNYEERIKQLTILNHVDIVSLYTVIGTQFMEVDNSFQLRKDIEIQHRLSLSQTNNKTMNSLQSYRLEQKRVEKMRKKAMVFKGETVLNNTSKVFKLVELKKNFEPGDAIVAFIDHRLTRYDCNNKRNLITHSKQNSSTFCTWGNTH